MRKLLPLCALAAIAASLSAQENERPSQASKDYGVYRRELSLPTFGLAKIQAMVAKIERGDGGRLNLPDDQYNALTLEEKFTYTMIHGEQYTQVCFRMSDPLDQEKKIFSYFPGLFDNTATWSDRQREFLQKNRAPVIKFLKFTILAKNRVGVNLKNAIQEINGVELIPTLIQVYNRDKKDHDILTLLGRLMNQNKYQAFQDSPIGKELYGEKSNYRTFVMATDESKQFITAQAAAFHKTLKSS